MSDNSNESYYLQYFLKASAVYYTLQGSSNF